MTTTVDPKAIDRQLGDIATEISTHTRTIEQAVESLHYAADDKHTATSYRRRVWGMSDSEAETIVRERIAAGTLSYRYDDSAPRTIAALDAARARVRELRDTYHEVEQPYRDAPWSRYYLVTSSDGHIHSSTSCSSCRPSTQYGWLIDMSGESEADTVAAHGALLCTFCYPSAPVSWTNGRELEQAAKAAAECPGSKTMHYDRATARTGYVTGNAGTCTDCGQRITLTSIGRLRAHKPA